MRHIPLVALAALALGGCGNELDEFRDDLRPLEQRAAEQRSRISSALRSVRLGSNADARMLREQTNVLRAAYDAIATLEPPDDYERPFAAYAKANDQAVRHLGEFASELAEGDARGLRRATRRVVHDLGRSQSARLEWLE